MNTNNGRIIIKLSGLNLNGVLNYGCDFNNSSKDKILEDSRKIDINYLESKGDSCYKEERLAKGLNAFKKSSKYTEFINKFKYIIELKDNWDDDGAKGITSLIFNKSEFITKHIFNLLSNTVLSPNNDGSIDISGEINGNSVLINVNENNIIYDIFSKVKLKHISGELLQIEAFKKELSLLQNKNVVQA